MVNDMGEEDNDTFSVRDMEQAMIYKDSLNYQLILGKQIDRIARFRDMNLKQYASSIDTLIIMLSKDMRGQAINKRNTLGLKAGDYDGMNIIKQSKYDELWITVNNILENNSLIFKTRSYEHGKEE